MSICSKENPFFAKILERRVLNKPGSHKSTVHVTLDITGSNLSYKVGDSIAVFPENSSELVAQTLEALSLKGEVMIQDSRSGESYTLHNFLKKKANISRVSKKLMTFVLEHVEDAEEKRRVQQLLDSENRENFKVYTNSREIWDCLREFKTLKVAPQDFVDLLTPLLPRFYSIASSQLENPATLDLVIAYFQYKTNEHLRYGVASHYLCEESPLNLPTVPMYLHPSKNFTVPSCSSTPIIMVGPGTGVAPYRGFMQERKAIKASGKNWLFFGDWNEKTDFYYEDEWRAYEKQGLLKLSYAFSRDQEEKYYVQDQMKKSASELWKWIQDGAYFYVCGDARHMAKDVDQMLHEIIEVEGQMSPEEAKVYVKEMRTQNRYLRDVY